MRRTQVESLRFGYRTQREALSALGSCDTVRRPSAAVNRLMARLTAYARGDGVDVTDIELAERPAGRTSPFARRVIAACRRIPAGETRTYGELAAAAGSPGAARAVGRCMASNPVPIRVPCHRVVGGDGKLHGYSAVGGLAMKRRLLAMERRAREAVGR